MDPADETVNQDMVEITERHDARNHVLVVDVDMVGGEVSQTVAASISPLTNRIAGVQGATYQFPLRTGKRVLVSFGTVWKHATVKWFGREPDVDFALCRAQLEASVRLLSGIIGEYTDDELFRKLAMRGHSQPIQRSTRAVLEKKLAKLMLTSIVDNPLAPLEEPPGPQQAETDEEDFHMRSVERHG